MEEFEHPITAPSGYARGLQYDMDINWEIVYMMVDKIVWTP